MPARGRQNWLDAQSTPPGSDCAPVYCGQRTKTQEASREQSASPLFTDDLSGLPPAHVVTAGFDPLRDEGEAYAARLRDAGVRATQRRHGSLIHGFINMAPVNRASHDASCEMAGVLRGALGG